MFNENIDPISDVNSESRKREYKPGKFYNGNAETGVEHMKEEGSQGWDYDQGAMRCSMIPEIIYMEDGQENKERLKTQGSHNHLQS